MDIPAEHTVAIQAATKVAVQNLFDTIIKPNIEQLGTWFNKQNKDEKIFENKFIDYLNGTFKRLININTLVFPNQQINIEDIYCPLTIQSTRDNTKWKVDNKDFSFISTYQKILISDNAGMGKSTLSKWIGLSLIKNCYSIPVLIELKRLNSRHKVIDELLNQFDPIDREFDRELIYKFLKLGSFTIIFDGFDEIELSEREAVIKDLKDFLSKTHNNKFFLTSRPDSALTSFGEFQMFRIVPLRQKESFSLIEKYDKVSGLKIAKKLIDEIQNKQNQIKEFLVNPFLVSLLYKTYSYNKDIPSKKSTFYEEVYTALYKYHDLSKDGFERNKKSGLDIHDFRVVLRRLAFETTKAMKVEYDFNELVKYLKQVKSKCIGINFKEVSYIEDLESNVPLFVKDGNLLKWAHKSIQDYFTSEFISSSIEKEKIIERLIESKKDNYLNIIEFLYELEYEIFRKKIIKKTISDFITYCDNSYNEYSHIKKSVLRERQALNYESFLGIFVTENNVGFDDVEEKYKDEMLKSKYKLVITRIVKKYEKNIVLYAGISNYQGIYEILKNNNEPIFLENNKNYHSEINLDISILSETPNNINEEKDNIFNNKKHFEAINNLIFSQLIGPGYSSPANLLDYNKCMKLRNEIEKEISLKKNDDLEGI